jgi:hypothetical protein
MRRSCDRILGNAHGRGEVSGHEINARGLDSRSACPARHDHTSTTQLSHGSYIGCQSSDSCFVYQLDQNVQSTSADRSRRIRQTQSLKQAVRHISGRQLNGWFRRKVHFDAQAGLSYCQLSAKRLK